MKSYSGFTSDTSKNLLLNAGAFFKNFDVESDTFESAVTANKLIGATSGGGEFSAKPTYRQIPVDGVHGRAKGLEVLDEWEVYIKHNILEITKETLADALSATTSSEVKLPSTAQANTHYKIEGKTDVSDNDYLNNITWVGTISGSNEPVIIQVFNALSTDGLTLSVQDKNQGVIATTFYGHYSADDLDTPPFAIYYPKQS